METFELTAELVEEFTEKLVDVDEAKQAIKTAIEGKGQDLTDIPFTGYANKISAIAGGKKFTTGTVTFATNATTATITHNLGVTPSIFLFYANYGLEDIYTANVIYIDNTVYSGMINKQYKVASTSASFASTPLTGGVSKNNETEITITPFSSAYPFHYGYEYTWIAIE